MGSACRPRERGAEAHFDVGPVQGRWTRQQWRVSPIIAVRSSLRARPGERVGQGMSRLTDQHYLRTDQYRDSSNLDARAGLHERFSVNRYGWHRWVFDRLNLAPDCRVLELGCGPVYLWHENRDRIPEGWEINLSDPSPGMVQRARLRLGLCHRRLGFAIIDAQAIPFGADTFDGVIANHMLYHVPDQGRALAEIRRVLRPGGLLYASTVGRTHLQELDDLVQGFRSAPSLEGLQPKPTFVLENGGDLMSRWFSNVLLHRYEDGLVITEARPLAAYVASSFTRSETVGENTERFAGFVERELARHGAIHISKDSGMFEAF